MELDGVLFNREEIPFEDTILTSKMKRHSLKAKTLMNGNDLIWLKTSDGLVYLTQKKYDKALSQPYQINDEEKVYYAYVNDNEDKPFELVILLENGSIVCMPNNNWSYIDEWAPYRKGKDPVWKGHRFNV